jgi:hypothetical protein
VVPINYSFFFACAGPDTETTFTSDETIEGVMMRLKEANDSLLQTNFGGKLES